MNNQVIDPEQKRTLNLFAKRDTRLLQHEIVSGSEIYEVVAVDDDRVESGYPSYSSE